MKYKTLSFFRDFKCIGGNCKHNCCLNWEIDIDKKSIKKYKKLKGDLGARLIENIDYNNSRFKMQKSINGTRCPFLNSENLCEIIINSGEKSLCQVCYDHPRYRNFFSNCTEWGVGLCCEQNAKNVICFSDKVQEVSDIGHFYGKLKNKNKIRKSLENYIIDFRQSIVEIVQQRETDINKRFREILEFCEVDYNKLKNFEFKKYLNGLESIDTKFINKILDFKILEINERFSIPFEQIAVYFIYRHLPDSQDRIDVLSRCVFALLSCYIINYLFLSQNIDNEIDNLISISRQYSEEIEYSQNNTNLFLDVIDRFTAI